MLANLFSNSDYHVDWLQAKEQHGQIQAFVSGTIAESAPIIPISAQLKYNIEVLCEYITTKIPVPGNSSNNGLVKFISGVQITPALGIET